MDIKLCAHEVKVSRSLHTVAVNIVFHRRRQRALAVGTVDLLDINGELELFHCGEQRVDDLIVCKSIVDAAQSSLNGGLGVGNDHQEHGSDNDQSGTSNGHGLSPYRDLGELDGFPEGRLLGSDGLGCNRGILHNGSLLCGSFFGGSFCSGLEILHFCATGSTENCVIF